MKPDSPADQTEGALTGPYSAFLHCIFFLLYYAQYINSILIKKGMHNCFGNEGSTQSS